MNNSKFKIGDKVEVMSDCQTTGAQGVVQSINGHLITVNLDNSLVRVYNKSSLKEVKFVVEDLDYLSDYLVVSVKHENSYTLYDFICYDKDVKISDIVICDTAKGFQTGVIKHIKNRTQNNNLKEIVSIVDLTEFNKRKESKKKKQELANKIKEKARKIEKEVLYTMLAERDEDFAQLLKDYNEME